MRNKLLLLLFTVHCSLFAQREADCFAVGYCRFNPTPNCAPPYGSSIYKFNEDGLEHIYENAGLNLSTDYSCGAFSDRHTGELIFASNGWRLVNRSGQVLAHKLYRDGIPHPGNTPDTTAVLNTLGPLFLNDPGDSTKAYLFYGQHRLDDFGTPIGFTTYDVLFTYAYLDIPTQSLISKNNVLLDELTAPSDAQACRHANGRDWWLIKPGQYDDEYHIGILNPQGINLEKITVQGLPHREQTLTFTYFNQDGTGMFHFIPLYSELHAYNFDRCSGELSNLIVHDLKDSIVEGDWNACNISPDGSKFYFRRSTGGILQYDLETLEYTEISKLGTAPQLTPNYKHILLASNIITDNDSIIETISTIYEPNKPGLECNFVMHTDTVINIFNLISPRCFANFRLGALKGSGCDTIVGINEVKAGRLKVYPNPSRDVLTVELSENSGEASLALFSVTGQQLLYVQLYSSSEKIQIGYLPPGLYLAKLTNSDGTNSTQRIVIAR